MGLRAAAKGCRSRAVLAGLILLTACGHARPEVELGPASTAVTAAGAATGTDPNPETSVPTSEALSSEHEALMGALEAVLVGELAMSTSGGGTKVPRPDEGCFERAAEELTPNAKGSADQIVDDPQAWDGLGGDDAWPLVAAYLGCVDIDALRTTLALGTLNSVEDLPCVTKAWEDAGLTAEVVIDGSPR